MNSDNLVPTCTGSNLGDLPEATIPLIHDKYLIPTVSQRWWSELKNISQREADMESIWISTPDMGNFLERRLIHKVVEQRWDSIDFEGST